MSHGFEDFWRVYPRKEGRAACLKKWEQKKLDPLSSLIVAHVQKRAKEDKKWRDGFVPMPLTFLNQERWTDEYERISVKDPARAPTPQAPAIYPQGCQWESQLNSYLLGALMRTKARCTMDQLRAAVGYKRQVGRDLRAMYPDGAADSDSADLAQMTTRVKAEMLAILHAG